MTKDKAVDKIISELKERAKELNCLYGVQEILNKSYKIDDKTINNIVNKIPPGFQYPEITSARIVCPLGEFKSDNFKSSKWVLEVDIIIQSENIGKISVYYSSEMPPSDIGPFLKEEDRLLRNIAERIGLQIFHEQLKGVFESGLIPESKAEWAIVLDMLSQTDPKLLVRLSRKMINHLSWIGAKGLDKLIVQFSPLFKNADLLSGEINQAFGKSQDVDINKVSHEIFQLAGKHISEKEIIDYIQKWTREDRSGFLSEILENQGSSFNSIANAVERYEHMSPNMLELSEARKKSFSIALIRKTLTDQYEFIQIAKNHLEINDFCDVFHKTIYPSVSYGKLGGKSSGLMLAKKIMKSNADKFPLLQNIKTPKTWYISSDALISFMSYNKLDEILEQKYKDIKQVKQEYPYVIHVFKNSLHTPEIVKGLLAALDDIGDKPLIVRSSSLLEDRIGSVFAGKYKSLFLANRGSKEEKLKNLSNAIAEVYASTFGPDPIEYRRENRLLDFHEEMGIMIQEVVGVEVGPYYFPAFAGMGFSNNQFRWSERLKAEDGLLRLVPGLGTRAVDRLKDDYPVLISPGQPELKVNVGIDETIRYSPKYIDLINLETSEFETLPIDKLLKRYGKKYPMFSRVISVIKEDYIQPARPLGTDFNSDEVIVNFEGLIKRTEFIEQSLQLLKTLEEAYGQAVDIEFAHDGKDLYLLQCRSQSNDKNNIPAEIPKSFDPAKALFSAKKYVPNGKISGIKHIVYVDADAYSTLKTKEEMLAVGRIVGELNKKLKPKSFILMGPGRWGSRGDLKLGVNVTYSDINNTAALIEIARIKNNYVPDLSFGTHFFQDLVEAGIKYIPLYPDETENIFNENFLKQSKNHLCDIIDCQDNIENAVRLINIEEGELKIYMNSLESKCLALIG